MGSRRNVEINLDLESRDAQRRVKDLARDIGGLDDEMGDVESAGKKMARALEQSADDMIDEIDATKRAVEQLEQALGPGFDTDTREVVADLKQLGLTAADIEADAEELAAALKRAGDVKVHATENGFDDLGQAVGSVREETGRTKDTMSGFIGGTVGELPGISNALGPVAEGLGQLTEGALSGEVAMKQLVGAGLAMGAAGLAVQFVVKNFEKMAAIKAWRTEQVDALAEAIYETGDAAEALLDTLAKTGKIEVKGIFNDVEDITSTLARAGVTADDWADAVQGGAEALDTMGAELVSAGIGGRDAADVLFGLRTAQEDFADATEDSTERTAVFGDATEDTTDAAGDLADQLSDTRDRVDDLTASLIDAAGGAHDLESAQLDLANAAAGLEQAVADTDAVLADSASTDAEKAQALRDLRGAQIDVAEQALSTAQAYATEAGAADGSAHSARLQVEYLRQVQAQYPNNAAAVQPYIDKLLQVPGNVDTQISADTRSANSNLDSLMGKLRAIGSNATTAAVVASARFRRYATGTAHAPDGSAIVGEDGPELVELPGGSKVHNARNSARMTAGGAGNTIMMHFPVGITPDQVTRATRLYDRRNS